MITVTPDPLVQGQPAQVCVSGSSHHGERIVVEIDNGEGTTSSVNIDLDAQGAGCAQWTVADWESANFNYGSCEQLSREIVPPPPPPGE